MIQYRGFHCKFICRAESDVIEALHSESDSYHSEADNVWRPSMTKSHKCWNLTEIQSPFKSRSKRVFVDQLSRVASRSYPSGSAWSSQMSTAKKNLGLYIVDCVVRVISISRPMERCSRTLNSAARLVATNCKKVCPKCSADDNTKYWHKLWELEL